jgi:hypothetical protein
VNDSICVVLVEEKILLRQSSDLVDGTERIACSLRVSSYNFNILTAGCLPYTD